MTAWGVTPAQKARPVIQGNPWGRRILILIVGAYITALILAPVIALSLGAFEEGLGAIWAALSQPDVLSAFWLTILIGLFVVSVHAIAGTVVAWVFVRDRFPGKN